MAPQYRRRPTTEPASVRLVHLIADAFRAAEFELLVACIFLLALYTLKFLLVSVVSGTQSLFLHM